VYPSFSHRAPRRIHVAFLTAIAACNRHARWKIEFPVARKNSTKINFTAMQEKTLRSKNIFPTYPQQFTAAIKTGLTALH